MIIAKNLLHPAARQGTVALPAPRRESGCAVEQALRDRRSVRAFGMGGVLTQEELSQLLWAAQGVTSPEGLRTAPSAGALYPLELYVATGRVRELSAGLYHYVPADHRLLTTMSVDVRAELAAAAYGQSWVGHAAVVIVFAAAAKRTTRKYGHRGLRYTHIEVGHAAQNVLLQAGSLGLVGTPVGAFDDERVAATLNLAAGEEPLYLLPLGRR